MPIALSVSFRLNCEVSLNLGRKTSDLAAARSFVAIGDRFSAVSGLSSSGSPSISSGSRTSIDRSPFA